MPVVYFNFCITERSKPGGAYVRELHVYAIPVPDRISRRKMWEVRARFAKCSSPTEIYREFPDAVLMKKSWPTQGRPRGSDGAVSRLESGVSGPPVKSGRREPHPDPEVLYGDAKRVNYKVAAEAIGCSDRHIRNLVEEGKLTRVGIPRKAMITTASLRKYSGKKQK